VAECLYHYTDQQGYNSIRAQPVWVFKVSQPPGDHPLGAYFTTLDPKTPRLAQRLGLPREKLKYVFCFRGSEGLRRLRGGRGQFILYSPQDYTVPPSRQVYCGPTS